MPELYDHLNRDCFRWKIGNGETILFWEDNWLRQGPLMNFFPRLYRISNLKSSSVRNFHQTWLSNLNNPSCLWNRNISSRDASEMDAIHGIISDLSLSSSQDVLFWM